MPEIRRLKKPLIYTHIIPDWERAQKRIIHSYRSPTTDIKYSVSIILTEELLKFAQYKKIDMLQEEALCRILRTKDEGWTPSARDINFLDCIYCGSSMSCQDYAKWRRPCPCIIRSLALEKEVMGASISSE